MDWQTDIVAALGRSMGAAGLGFNPSGVACLVFERKGLLYLERADTALMVCLSRPLPQGDPDISVRALRVLEPQRDGEVPFNAGIFRESLCFTARLERQHASVPSLCRVLDRLERLHELVAGGVS